MESTRARTIGAFCAGVAFTVLAALAIEPLFASEDLEPPPAIDLEGPVTPPAARPDKPKRDDNPKGKAPAASSASPSAPAAPAAAPSAPAPSAPAAPPPSGGDGAGPQPKPPPRPVAPAPAAPAPVPSDDDDDDDDDGTDDD